MKTILTLAAMRIRITLRNKTFLFFSLIMPMVFFFLYGSVFAKGVPQLVTWLMGPVLSLTVMGTFWGLSMQLVTWREQGILRRFRLAPIPPAMMIASSVIANYALILPTVILQFLFRATSSHRHGVGAALVFIYNPGGLGITSFGALGLIVASVTDTIQATQIIINFSWLRLFLFPAQLSFLRLFPRS